MDFTRATSNVPGPAPSLLYEYWPHPSGLCHMYVWRPAAASFASAQVAVVVHGGLGYNPGDRAMTSDVFGGAKIVNSMNALRDAGWVIISIDYPACAANQWEPNALGTAATNEILGTWHEIPPVAMWPEQAGYLALAIQHIKTHYTGSTTNADYSAFGATLWGAGNSIDPTRIHVYGESWGGTMAAYVALQPTGYYPFFPRLGHEIVDPYLPRASHRVISVSFASMQTELGQFYVDTGFAGPQIPIYGADRLQPFMGSESGRKWSTLPLFEKKHSPWWILKENHQENVNLSFFGEFLGTGFGGGFDESLGQNGADWSPGSVRNDVAGGKAWVDPHDGRIQGRPWYDALVGYEPAAGQTGAAIARSDIRWVGTGSTRPGYSASNYVTKFKEWLASLGYTVAA